MPSWNEVLKELQSLQRPDALDATRKKYLGLLHKKRDRNIIAYYSGWLQHNVFGTEIDDTDKNMFMTAIHKLDREKGLDLILHTPGGNVAATESLVDYLRKMFGTDIEVFIPQIAMSAGTMMACAAKKIHMGKQSSIGPIDPQFGGIPAAAVLDEFERAASECKRDPSRIAVWQFILQKYHPTFILQCENSIAWSKEIVGKWLRDGMFDGDSVPNKDGKIKNIIERLSDHNKTRSHGRHISSTEAEEIGLAVEHLEKDNDLQDLVLTVHHTFMHTFSHSPCAKIVENHKGVLTVFQFQPTVPQKA